MHSCSTDQQAISTGRHTVSITGLTEGWSATLSTNPLADGLHEVRVRLESATPRRPPSAKLSWRQAVVDTHSHWNAEAMWNRANGIEWQGISSKLTAGAPVHCLYNLLGQNRLTFALSDAMNRIRLYAAVHEETAHYNCSITLFTEPATPIRVYEATLRLDTRDIPYYDALGQVQAWWASLPGFTPAPVPEPARLPMYSTWYSFHQQLEPAAIEAQCRIAKALGCAAVIVDDGWQTLDSARGYSYCGDWEPERMPEMRAHVARVHALGMKYLLWFAVPFIGKHTRAVEKFAGKFLFDYYDSGTYVIDPRFPETREYLIGLYERAVRAWDLDGLKLDFIDAFNLPKAMENVLGGGRDYDSVPEAVDRLLTDVLTRLRAIKPDFMVEFRQTYIGPLMRKYGNMFRACDCPDDSISNRVRTIDIRLLCGNTAAHADMVMWHPDEPVESAALQLVQTLFAVPQVSMLLDKLPERHLAMLTFWLKFWREHRDVLLDGHFTPLHPEALFPVVIAATAATRVVAVYGDVVVNPGADAPAELLIVNGTLLPRVVLELADDLGVREVEVLNCCGEPVRRETLHLTPGLHALAIPACGVARCVAK